MEAFRMNFQICDLKTQIKITNKILTYYLKIIGTVLLRINLMSESLPVPVLICIYSTSRVFEIAIIVFKICREVIK
jgi:hypothetical protein